MPALRFKQVDVFTEKPLFGNPVAVVIGGEGLDTATMQRIAAWTNLSETTFLLPSDKADYRLRIFTPRRELPFAGHPTLGSAHAALEAGFVTKKQKLKQECLAGVLDLQVEEGEIFVRGPRAKVTAIDAKPPVQLVSAPLRVDVGVVWAIGEVADAIMLAELEPDPARITDFSNAIDAAGLALFAPSRDGVSAIHVRAFAPAHGIPEDPVTGSANVAIPSYLREKKYLERFGRSYVARQGMQVGRDGRVSVRIADDGDWIGGRSVTCVEGSLKI
ncbi:MAG TPA: PhzF family phenazine biosynthesis protein [Burkholderiales bacterium]|nr:PhzF family phenazine biosynthesis protein [Burkholderiales bacterium]